MFPGLFLKLGWQILILDYKYSKEIAVENILHGFWSHAQTLYRYTLGKAALHVVLYLITLLQSAETHTHYLKEKDRNRNGVT